MKATLTTVRRFEGRAALLPMQLYRQLLRCTDAIGAVSANRGAWMSRIPACRLQMPLPEERSGINAVST